MESPNWIGYVEARCEVGRGLNATAAGFTISRVLRREDEREKRGQEELITALPPPPSVHSATPSPPGKYEV